MPNSSDYILQSEVCHDGFFQLKRHTVQYPKFDGSLSKVHKRELFVREPTVGAIVYDPENALVLFTEQFRIGPLENNETPWIFELPAGIVEQGEDKADAMAREIEEETGYRCQVKELIGEFYMSPGGSSELTSVFYCEASLDTSGVFGATGENEDIKTHIVPLDEALGFIQSKKLSASAAIGILWLAQNK
ncbi:NUDIX hydrolase [Aliikangiella marina]|uniref:ADP-ribose pyrophosphatase n=1 Tax=Aliikangiella marina TaxID=1712262 RepID=A0A545T4V3_9GAMM|nr:NUDIX hydrolase [Aliikangiella marina]TQV72236.1 NUDIX hydrolase [Aliikangiella marina]